MVFTNKTQLFKPLDSELTVSVLGSVAAGFPSPADDYLEEQLNLHQHLIRHPSATFFVRVSGDSMIGAGIYSGDLLIVDRSLSPRNRQIVVAVVDNQFTVKRLLVQRDCCMLVAEHPDYAPIRVDDESFSVWGVVIYNIHKLS
jgi:DNA polymerase V